MRTTKISQIKHSFFSHSVRELVNISFTDEDFNLDQLRTEFTTMYQLFLSNKEFWSKNPEIVFYMIYLCDLLIRYYECDYVRNNLNTLKKQKQNIELFIQKHFMDQGEVSFHKLSDFLMYRLKSTAENYAESIMHIAQFRDRIDNLSATKSRLSQGRSLAVYAIKLIQNSSLSELIQELNVILGNQFSFVEGMDFINQSAEIMTIIGIVLFTVRFMINWMLLLKHTVQAYWSHHLSVKKVLQQELDKRGFIMASDLVWSIVSLLTNYNIMFKVAAASVPIVLGCFLVFDALLIVSNWYLGSNKYEKNLQELLIQLSNATDLEKGVIQRQIELLNDEWEAQRAYLMINLLSAFIIALSFSIACCLTNPIGLGIMALCSMLGNALSNTSNDYKKFVQTRMALRRELANGSVCADAHHKKLVKALTDEMDDAFNNFCKNVLFNIAGIAFIITIAVASWPVALCLTVLYIGYQLINTYQKQLSINHADEVEHDVYRHLLPQF